MANETRPMQVVVMVPIHPHFPAEAVKEELLALAGGMTVTRSLGSYQMESGEVCTEAVDQVMLFMPKSRELALHKCLHRYRVNAKQEAVMFYIADLQPVLLTGDVCKVS